MNELCETDVENHEKERLPDPVLNGLYLFNTRCQPLRVIKIALRNLLSKPQAVLRYGALSPRCANRTRSGMSAKTISGSGFERISIQVRVKQMSEIMKMNDFWNLF